MILFEIFHINKIVKGIKENPGKLAGEEISDVLWGIVIIPLIIGGLGIILFFILGYTNLFGFHFWFFKFLFWMSLIIGIIIFSIIRKIFQSVSKKTMIHTESVIKTFTIEKEGENK